MALQMMTNDRIRLLIADESELFREGLALQCARMPGLEVVGIAGDTDEAILLASSLQPDVVLVDVSMLGIDGIRATAQVGATGNGARILVLTEHRQPRLVFQAFQAGALGYLLKDTRSEELLNAIHAVSRGEEVIDPELAMLTLEDIAGRRADVDSGHSDDPMLTANELTMLKLVAKGKSNAEIAADLGLAGSTVANRLREIYRKLQVSSRTQAALVALRRGWTTLDAI